MIEPPSGATPRPQLDLRVARRGDRSHLAQRLFCAPFVLTRTFRAASPPMHMLEVVTQTSTGALCAGDAISQRVHVEAGAALHIRNQGATCVHRAAVGTQQQEHVELSVAAGGHLEYLPEPKILFPGSALRQHLRLHCAPGGSAILSDAFLLHDPSGSGRPFRSYESEISIHDGGAAPLVSERVELPRLPIWTGRRARFRAFGTLFMILPAAEGDRDGVCDAINRACDVAGVYGAASLLPVRGGLVLRLACHDGGALRHGLERGWRAFRRAAFGVEPESRIR